MRGFVQGTEIDIWPRFYLHSNLGWCKFVLETDETFFIDVIIDGVLHRGPDLNLIEQMCLNNCSNNGVCAGGRCICEPSYKGRDCSIDINQPVEIKALSISKNCDFRTQMCSQILIHGNGLVVEGNIYVHVFILEVFCK